MNKTTTESIDLTKKVKLFVKKKTPTISEKSGKGLYFYQESLNCISKLSRELH